MPFICFDHVKPNYFFIKIHYVGQYTMAILDFYHPPSPTSTFPFINSFIYPLMYNTIAKLRLLRLFYFIYQIKHKALNITSWRASEREKEYEKNSTFMFSQE